MANNLLMFDIARQDQTLFLFLCPSLSYFNHPLSVLFCAPKIKQNAVQNYVVFYQYGS